MTTLRDIAGDDETADRMVEYLEGIFRDCVIAVVGTFGVHHATGWRDSLQSVIRSLKESDQ